MFQAHCIIFFSFFSFPRNIKYQAKVTKFMASDYCVLGICAFVSFPPPDFCPPPVPD